MENRQATTSFEAGNVTIIQKLFIRFASPDDVWRVERLAVGRLTGSAPAQSLPFLLVLPCKHRHSTPIYSRPLKFSMILNTCGLLQLASSYLFPFWLLHVHGMCMTCPCYIVVLCGSASVDLTLILWGRFHKKSQSLQTHRLSVRILTALMKFLNEKVNEDARRKKYGIQFMSYHEHDVESPRARFRIFRDRYSQLMLFCVTAVAIAGITHWLRD